MSGCAAFNPTGAYAAQMLALTDCRTLAIARGGWQALAGGGGALAGLLAVFVALLGYRWMLGHGPSLAQGAGLVARVALVMALVTQWPAYQVLVFDVATGAPPALAAALGGAAGLGPLDAGAQAAKVDALVAQAAGVVVAEPVAAVPMVPLRAGLRMAAPSAPSATSGVPDTIKTPLHWASGVLTVTVLGGWLSTRLLVGVLLGLGPVLAAGLLFAGTRGLALGWVRVLVGASLGQVLVAVAVAMELDIAQAQMAGVIAALNAGDAPVAMADALLVTVMVFAAVLLGGLAGVARLAAGLAWPEAAWHRAKRASPAAPQARDRVVLTATDGGRGTASQRVTRIAAAARAMDRREIARATPDQPASITAASIIEQGPAAQARDPSGARILRLGQSVRRGPPRLSRLAVQRDANA